jgi:hypothetical protein
MLNAIVVVNGRVVGTWRRTLKGNAVAIEVSAFGELTAESLRALEKEKERYAKFVGRERAATI